MKKDEVKSLTLVVDHAILVGLNSPHELVHLPVGELLAEGGQNCWRRGDKSALLLIANPGLKENSP